MSTTLLQRETEIRTPDCEDSPCGYHCWRNLLFVHWRLPAALVEPLIPPGLTLDTYDGSAWVAIVPFTMHGVRPAWFPALPGVSAFHETNVRTYVHLDGEDPGVWFFSLDAANALAAAVARARWHLAYHWAAMELVRRGDRVLYTSQRKWPSEMRASSRIEVEVGEFLTDRLADGNRDAVAEGSLEHFLAERYVLYAQSRGGNLYRGRVAHDPYPLRHAEICSLDETMLAAAGIRTTTHPEHVMFSEGVDVQVYSLERVP